MAAAGADIEDRGRRAIVMPAVVGEQPVGFRCNDLRLPDFEIGAIDISRRVLAGGAEHGIEDRLARLPAGKAVTAGAAPRITLAEHRDGVRCGRVAASTL